MADNSAQAFLPTHEHRGSERWGVSGTVWMRSGFSIARRANDGGAEPLHFTLTPYPLRSHAVSCLVEIAQKAQPYTTDTNSDTNSNTRTHAPSGS